MIRRIIKTTIVGLVLLCCVQVVSAADWTNVGSAGFTPYWLRHSYDYDNLNITVNPDNGQPYVSFRDPDNGNRATVMRFDGSNWIAVGTA